MNGNPPCHFQALAIEDCSTNLIHSRNNKRTEEKLLLRKAIVAIMMILLMAGISVLAFEMKERTISGASSNVWYVGPPPFDFATIQEAVDNESVVNGDTL
jgi:hypothetical protein